MAKHVAGYVHGVPASLCLLIHAVCRWLQEETFLKKVRVTTCMGWFFECLFSIDSSCDKIWGMPDLAEFHVVLQKDPRHKIHPKTMLLNQE